MHVHKAAVARNRKPVLARGVLTYKLVFGCRGETELCTRANDERADVQGTLAVGRNPAYVVIDCRGDSVVEHVHRNLAMSVCRRVNRRLCRMTQMIK